MTAGSAQRGSDTPYLGTDKETFFWQADAPLLPGQVFELVFIPENEPPSAGRATSAASPRADAYVSLPAPGRYTWGIWLAQAEPYVRLRYLGAGGNIVVVEPGGGGAGNDPADDQQPTPPQFESPLY